MIERIKWVMVVVLAAIPTLAVAQAPSQVPVQGYLTDTEGTPIDGETTIGFQVYDAETGVTSVFSETQSVRVDGGYFTAYLGDVETLDLAIFRDNSTLWIELVVDGETLSPRLSLATSPYAGYAEYAGTVDWSGITTIPGDVADGDADTTYTAGTGLSLAGTEFAVDPTATQVRVSGACAAGQAIRAVAEDGTVTCETTSSTYSAGTGLSLSGTTFSVDPTAVQQRVTGTCSGGQAIAAIGDDGSVTCVADADTTYDAGDGLTLSGTTFSVTPGGITGSMLAASSVTSAHVVDGTLTAADLGAGSVRGSEIALGVIFGYHMADSAVGPAQIADGAVGSSKIANGAVGSSERLYGSPPEIATPCGVFVAATTCPAGDGANCGGGMIDCDQSPAPGGFCEYDAGCAGLDAALNNCGNCEIYFRLR